jgi:hypothetical protein
VCFVSTPSSRATLALASVPASSRAARGTGEVVIGELARPAAADAVLAGDRSLEEACAEPRAAKQAQINTTSGLRLKTIARSRPYRSPLLHAYVGEHWSS